MGARKHNHARRHKTSRTSRKRDPHKLKLAFTNAEVAASWDIEKTVKQNYETLGLEFDANNGKSIAGHAPGLLSEALGIKFEWVDIPSEEIATKIEDSARNPRRADHWLSDEEIEYLQRLIHKHASGPAALDSDKSYEAMARDIKTNFKQHTAQHLKTRIARMKRYQEGRAAAELEAAAEAAAAAKLAASIPAVIEEEEEEMEAAAGAGDRKPAKSAASKSKKTAGKSTTSSK
jgi:hypothetical protein